MRRAMAMHPRTREQLDAMTPERRAKAEALIAKHRTPEARARQAEAKESNQKKTVHLTRKPSSLKVFANIAGTFILLMFTFIIFRADSISRAFDYYRKLFSPSIFYRFAITEKINTVTTLIAIMIMLSAEWLQQDKRHALQIDAIKKFPIRAFIYFGLVFIILFFSPPKITDFIYFKF